MKHLFTRAQYFMVLAACWCMAKPGYAQTVYDDWDHLTPITLTNQTFSTLLNYEMKLTLDTETLINNGQLESDGRDMRFLLDACTPLCYYIESAINTDSTVVWVNVPMIPPNGATTIQMASGNSAAVSASDPSCTFSFFEGFDGPATGF